MQRSPYPGRPERGHVVSPAVADIQITGTIRRAANPVAPRVPPDTPVSVVRQLLHAYATHTVAVVDRRGRCVGTVSAGRMPGCVPGVDAVSDHMVPATISLPLDAPVALAAAIMAHEGMDVIPVDDTDGHFVALLEESDLLGWLGAHHTSP